MISDGSEDEKQVLRDSLQSRQAMDDGISVAEAATRPLDDHFLRFGFIDALGIK